MSVNSCNNFVYNCSNRKNLNTQKNVYFCPYTEEWIHKWWNMHIMKYYPAAKMNKLQLFASVREGSGQGRDETRLAMSWWRLQLGDGSMQGYYQFSPLLYTLKFPTAYYDLLMFLCFPSGSNGKESSYMWDTQVRSLGQEDPLEKGMSTHSSILVWRIPWTEEPGGPQSMGLQRVGHDWVTNTFTLCVFIYTGIFCLHLWEWGGRGERLERSTQGTTTILATS